MPTIPISNTFSPLRHVKKNAFRAHLRQAGEEPGPDVIQAPEAPAKTNTKPKWAQQIRRVYSAVQKREQQNQKRANKPGSSKSKNLVRQRITYQPGDLRDPKILMVKANTSAKKTPKRGPNSQAGASVFERLGPENQRPSNIRGIEE